jgi:signal transduction histidine kinase
VDTAFDNEPDLPLHVKEGLYRIGQEAMHNTVKHAHAKHVDLRMVQEDDGLLLEIRDDGEGFDPTGDFPGHLGITSMREGARALGEGLAIESAPGRVTIIRLKLKGQGAGDGNPGTGMETSNQ